MTRSLFPLLLLFTFLAPALSLTAAERDPMWKYPPDLPGATVETFKTIGDVDLKAWIFHPENHKPTDQRPAIVFYFGGGWSGGSPGQFYHQCQYLASRGMVAITVDYRVRNRHKTLAPVCLQDANSAIRWIRKHSKRLGVDPNRIVASGGSAGGHLAACTGIISGFDDPNDDLSISAVPNAMALYNPAVLLTTIDGDQQLAPEKVTDIKERTGNKSKELSPLFFVRENLPPSIIFHGTEDEAVPYWTVKRFAQEMTKAGNRCELKSFTGAPHGFFNTGRGGSPERLDLEQQRYTTTTYQLDKFLQSLGYLKGPATIAAIADPNIQMRGSYANSRILFEQNKKAHVAFIGGSITQMNGYRPMVCNWLQKKFPNTRFTFTNAGISSTGSTTGAFRVGHDVLSKGPVDLFLVEYAVNDDQDSMLARQNCIRGLEGIIQQARKHNHNADILLTHFVNPPMLKIHQEGGMPISQGSHEEVARHWNISTINVGKQVADEISAGTLTWKKYGGTHPKPFGNAIAARMIADLLNAAWDLPIANSAQPHPTPEQLLDSLSYANGRFVSKRKANIKNGWTIKVPNWKQIPGSFRDQFAGLELLCADKPGAEFTLKFKATAVGAYILAGPDAGQLEYSIDGGKPQTAELFHRYSKGLHYPRTVMFTDNLKPGPHTITVKVSSKHHKTSTGTAARIMELVVN